MEPTTAIVLWLAGDLMLGRGIDQIQRHSTEPRLYERYVKDAREYVQLAERAHGEIPRDVPPDHVWGDALAEVERRAADLGIVNLETSVTTSDAPWPGKGIHYRMHPDNVAVLSAADVDVVTLANNHAMDWGREGLAESVRSLESAGIEVVGAGRNAARASASATFEVAARRLAVVGLGLRSSGIPSSWAAGEDVSGINLVPADPPRVVARVRSALADHDDSTLALASVHWGGNWGYEIPDVQRRIAHRLIEEAGVDVVHGHSSHHVKGIEVHRNRLILYGSGDLLTDYEGISGHRRFRPDLSLLYFPRLDPASGRLLGLEMVPMRLRRFRLERASGADAAWLTETLNREGTALGTRVEMTERGTLRLSWPEE